MDAEPKVAWLVIISVAAGFVENALLIVNCSAKVCPAETVAVIVEPDLAYVPLVLLKL